jgi:hypothetical protein
VATLVHNFATHVLRYLAHNGSNVGVLNLSPYMVDSMMPNSLADKDGQQYPRYTYTKCSTQDGEGINRVIAIPLGDAVRQMAGTQIFSRRLDTWPIHSDAAHDFVAS